MGKRESHVDVDLPYIVELFRPRHKIVRVLWVIVFLAMIGIGLFMIVLLIIDYLAYGSFNVISVENIRNFTLPAITICNLSPINATAVKEKSPAILALYYSLVGNYKRLNDSSGSDLTDMAKELNSARLFQNKNFVMRPGRTVVLSETTFGRRDIGTMGSSIVTNADFTDLGYCLEINDDAKLVQQVEGPGGGLALVLDTNVDHYLSTVESEGFYITLRMPNETIVNKGFGFTVSPGEEVQIDIENTEVERLGEPWGNCENQEDLFNAKADETGDFLTHRECFLLQKLWLYFNNTSCRCFPWYFHERYLSSGKRYDSEISDRLLRYLINGVEADKRLNIRLNGTCKESVESNQKVYSGDTIKIVNYVANFSKCAQACRNESNCLVFVFAESDNDFLSTGQCQLFTENTDLVDVDSNKNITGLYLGYTNCSGTAFSECLLSQGMDCEDKTMRNVMTDGEEYQPFECTESCNYTEYRYTISRSRYPSRQYWDTTLSKTYTRFSGTADQKFQQAQQNLVKLIFFTQRMRKTVVVQTATYEIQSFIAEFGGLTDLFIGFSFFTLFQFLDIALTKCFGKKKKKENNREDLTLENIS